MQGSEPDHNSSDGGSRTEAAWAAFSDEQHALKKLYKANPIRVRQNFRKHYITLLFPDEKLAFLEKTLGNVVALNPNADATSFNRAVIQEALLLREQFHEANNRATCNNLVARYSDNVYEQRCALEDTESFYDRVSDPDVRINHCANSMCFCDSNRLQNIEAREQEFCDLMDQQEGDRFWQNADHLLYRRSMRPESVLKISRMLHTKLNRADDSLKIESERTRNYKMDVLIHMAEQTQAFPNIEQQWHTRLLTYAMSNQWAKNGRAPADKRLNAVGNHTKSQTLRLETEMLRSTLDYQTQLASARYDAARMDANVRADKELDYKMIFKDYLQSGNPKKMLMFRFIEAGSAEDALCHDAINQILYPQDNEEDAPDKPSLREQFPCMPSSAIMWKDIQAVANPLSATAMLAVQKETMCKQIEVRNTAEFDMTPNPEFRLEETLGLGRVTPPRNYNWN